MKEYIEREAIRNELYELDAITMVGVAAINNFQAADVAEVKHGRWVPDIRARKSADGYYLWNSYPEAVFVCSECGRVESYKEPYCHCGAKMDAEAGS